MVMVCSSSFYFLFNELFLMQFKSFMAQRTQSKICLLNVAARLSLRKLKLAAAFYPSL